MKILGMYIIASEYKDIFIGLISHYYLMSIGNMLSGKSIKEITLYTQCTLIDRHFSLSYSL